MHIGCLFGTFDPPHSAHVAIAEHMLHHLALDQVWLVVTPQNPFKQDRALSPDEHRLAMVALAVQGHPGLVASGFELELPRPNYTADTLRSMRLRWPEHRFDLIVGSDNLASFHRWKDPGEILDHHRLLVYPREGFNEHREQAVLRHHPRVMVVEDAPLLPVSATDLRNTLPARNDGMDGIDPLVLDYIRRHGLYAG